MRVSREEFERLRKMNAIDPPDRPPMSQEDYDAEYGAPAADDRPVVRRIGRSLYGSYCYPCSGVGPLMSAIVGFMPILRWLPRYDFRKNLFSDVVGGFTTGIMHVPQGIAYSSLAGVDPVYGLYASCFPAFFYMLFGTSRHASIGSFAVVALMAGVANDNVMMSHGGGTVELTRNASQFDVAMHYKITPIQVATTLTFAIGIWQMVCALLRLQFLMTYFSDPLVSGFTTGAAVHVLLAQIDDIMGVKVPKASGIGYIFKRIYDLVIRVPQVNVPTLVISFIAMTFLYVGKEFFSPLLARRCRLKIPIPYELMLVTVTAALSSIFHWHEHASVEIVGNIPAGIPHPELPTFPILGECLLQSIGIAIVIIAVHISMAKMLGKKMNYPVDDSQELYAIGLTSLLGGCFPVYPVSTALGRTMVNVKSGTKTQLSTIFSCALLLSIILWLGPLLRDLPKCILASIIAVALKSMFMKCGELKRIYSVSKIDYAVWMVSFFSTVFIDVMEGLAISILFALFTVICRTQWPNWQYFVHSTRGTFVADDEMSDGQCDMCIFRFEGPLLFTNVERFKNALRKTMDSWRESWQTKSVKGITNAISSLHPQNPAKKSGPHVLILDCASIAYCDYMAAVAFNEIAKELKSSGVVLYVAAANGSLRSTLQAVGIFQNVEKEHLFPTLRDAKALVNFSRSAVQSPDEALKEQAPKLDPHPLREAGSPSKSRPRTPTIRSVETIRF